ncbi:ATP-dependent helicase [Enteractinococcus coprophilus]|uniref:DNA 3'-5' helicase n=1 Tax=Enteractinococcus coprophilus TaxID=1027633 RepID=A0A543ANV4_9MICC|nr:ATP-dependent DNA helicase [Enteractinococcus coprophilus]TQL74235.1 DNA helicase-2/ATP-dependent DNA helicase PcrA [Enteractinococcus coprophilus]
MNDSHDAQPAQFDFGLANAAQRQAITATRGPVLITAGPGTGKTFTLVQRIIYLIDQEGVGPDEIFVATFTEKAAKELVTRISNELAARSMTVNVSEMYVGTFHSLCLRFLKEHTEHTRLKQGFRVLDGFDQIYTIYQNYHFFDQIDGIDTVLPNAGKWRKAEEIARIVNALNEELVSPESLESDNRAESQVVGRVFRTYLHTLSEENLLDFPSIQVEAHRLLNDSPEVLASYTSKIQYLMVDEYQDTNYIQEQLVFLLGGASQNICVVGDDDQGLYRFRGATIRNILEFPKKFSEDTCQVISLVENYRSHPDIVEFYNTWMDTTAGKKFKFSWDSYRYDKQIVAAGGQRTLSPAVIKVAGDDDTEHWHQQVLTFITELRDSGKLTDYNQLAFLFSSVKHPRVTALAKFLEDNGIAVYSPRSGMFFDRFEITLALGCLFLMFPNLVGDFEEGKYFWLKDDFTQYFITCIVTANDYLNDPENSELRHFVQRHGRSHLGLQHPTDYTFAGLLYQMFALPPFAQILSTDLDSGVVDLRPTRNLAQLTQIVGKFEHLHGINLLSPTKNRRGLRYIDSNAEKLVMTYLRLLYEGGITEYEDDSEYAPSGCVSFLTIHQSKGMEFPIVLVDSLKNVPRKQAANVLDNIAERHYHRPPFEPEDRIKFFDFWRLYYTAFSRAQNLLVLTCNEERSTPSRYFKDVYDPVPDWRDESVDYSEFNFEEVKDVNIKRAFSFTSHITVYETCSLQYKFFKELEFQPVRVSAQFFGRLVHQTIEDIHKAAIKGAEDTITVENVQTWFDANYTHLARAEKMHLADPTKKAALEQVLRYVKRQDGEWSAIKQAEVDVSLVKPDYILDGTIDLIRGEDGTVEIIDFKATRKPDMIADSEVLERYRRQLHVYAHLVEERTGEKVSKMHLYYTGETDGIPTITWPYTQTAVDATVQVFDDVVHKILDKNFTTRAHSLKTCEECDFKNYCDRTR